MNIILYKPLYYDLKKCSYDVVIIPEKGAIKDAINSFFLVKTSTHFCWLYTLKRDGRICDNYPSVFWSHSNPRKEVFKKLKVVSVY